MQAMAQAVMKAAVNGMTEDPDLTEGSIRRDMAGNTDPEECRQSLNLKTLK